MTKHPRPWLRALLVAGVAVASSLVDIGPSGPTLGPREASAIIGRPLTPMSYAGVARRTVRRTAAVAYGATAVAYGATAAAVRVATLPAGCVVAGGLYRCGAVTYRAAYDGPNVVYVQQ